MTSECPILVIERDILFPVRVTLIHTSGNPTLVARPTASLTQWDQIALLGIDSQAQYDGTQRGQNHSSSHLAEGP